MTWIVCMVTWLTFFFFCIVAWLNSWMAYMTFFIYLLIYFIYYFVFLLFFILFYYFLKHLLFHLFNLIIWCFCRKVYQQKDGEYTHNWPLEGKLKEFWKFWEITLGHTWVAHGKIKVVTFVLREITQRYEFFCFLRNYTRLWILLFLEVKLFFKKICHEGFFRGMRVVHIIERGFF